MSHWWPATGYRNNNSAALSNVANQANYWSSSPNGTNNAYDLYFNYDGNVNPSNNNNRSNGFSLRCVQDFTAG